ncbi:hypothetical protein PTI98_008661 [Pleurotus ostreatus]|nr:hypothetical protein PTI98_008661 [Pleurotus ostreatus]
MDDGWATFSSVGLFIFSVCTFVSLGHVEGVTAIALDYLVSELFYTVICHTAFGAAKMSKEHGHSHRPTDKYVFYHLFVRWFSTRISAGVAANAALLVLPATFLFDASLTNKQRVHMICTIAAVAFAAVASLVHGYFTLRVGGLPELVLAIIEASATLMACSAAIIATAVLDLIKKPSPSDRWIMTSSFNALSPTFSTDTVKTVHLSPRSGTSVSYEGNTPFRKSPSLWGPNGAGVHITEEKVSVLHFPTPAVLKRSA